MSSFVGSGKLVATTSTARSKYTTAIGGAHAFTKTVTVSAFCVGWLVGALRHVCLILGLQR